MKEPFLYLQIPGLEHYPHVTYTWFIMAALLVLSFLVTRSLRLIPDRFQSLVEVFVEGMVSFVEEKVGHNGVKYLPLFVTLAVFILISNLLGLVPGFMPPTSNVNTNLGMAVTVFIMVQVAGLRAHGLKYLKHFTGPILWLAPLMIPIELIGHFARILSLTIRLFGNIRGHEIIIGVISFYITQAIAPVVMMAFGILVALIQTFVFLLLSMIYVSLAVAEEH